MKKITWEFDSEPYALERDSDVRRAATKMGVDVSVCASHTLQDLDEYIINVGGNRTNCPVSYGDFQVLFNSLGPVPQPLDAPGILPFDLSEFLAV